MSAPHSRMPLMFWLRAKPASAALSGGARSSGSVVLPVCTALMVNLWAASADADFDARGRRAKKPSSGTTRPNPGATLPKPGATAPKPHAVPTSGAMPTTGAADAQRSGDVLISRYTTALLQQPGDTFPLQRLAELYREHRRELAKVDRRFRRKTHERCDQSRIVVGPRVFQRGRRTHRRGSTPTHAGDGNSPAQPGTAAGHGQRARA